MTTPFSTKTVKVGSSTGAEVRLACHVVGSEKEVVAMTTVSGTADTVEQTVLMRVPNIVVVPDLAAVDLTAEAKLNLTHIHYEYEKWNYYADLDRNPISGRGLKFEVFIHTPQLEPGETIESETIRSYFRPRGFMGHVGAFTQWRRTCGLEGNHATIPEDHECLRGFGNDLFVPFSYFVGDRRELSRNPLIGGWGTRWSFVAFRMVY